MGTPIPKSARPVRDYIRANVKRPRKLPAPVRYDGTLLRWRRGDDAFCPLGLCPTAKDSTPIGRAWFDSVPPGFTERGIRAFYSWWDRQTNARDAVNAVWGKR